MSTYTIIEFEFGPLMYAQGYVSKLFTFIRVIDIYLVLAWIICWHKFMKKNGHCFCLPNKSLEQALMLIHTSLDLFVAHKKQGLAAYYLKK